MQAVTRAGYDRPTAAAVLDKPHRASLHRHAADILVRRTVGDAVDGAGGTYYHGDRRTLSRAHGVHAVHHSCQAGRYAGHVAALLSAVARDHPRENRSGFSRTDAAT